MKNAKVAFTTTAAQLWPYKFASNLLTRLLERTSINVQTHTPVTFVSSNQDGSSLAHTPRGSIRAKKVVFTTNAYTAGIAHSYSETIVPVKVTCTHIKTPKDTSHPPPYLTQTYRLSFGTGPGIRDYLIPRPNRDVICGGAKDTLRIRNSGGIILMIVLLLNLRRKHFETVMQYNFRGWEKSGALLIISGKLAANL